MQRRPQLIDVARLVIDLARCGASGTTEYHTVLDVIASQPRVPNCGNCFQCKNYDPDGANGYCYWWTRWTKPHGYCHNWEEREYD